MHKTGIQKSSEIRAGHRNVGAKQMEPLRPWQVKSHLSTAQVNMSPDGTRLRAHQTNRFTQP